MRKLLRFGLAFAVVASALAWSAEATAKCRNCTNAWFVMQTEWRHKIPDSGLPYGQACGNLGAGPCHSEYDLGRCMNAAHPEGSHPQCIIVDADGPSVSGLTNQLLAAAEAGDRKAIATLALYAPMNVKVTDRSVAIIGCGGQLVALSGIGGADPLLSD